MQSDIPSLSKDTLKGPPLSGDSKILEKETRDLRNMTEMGENTEDQEQRTCMDEPEADREFGKEGLVGGGRAAERVKIDESNLAFRLRGSMLVTPNVELSTPSGADIALRARSAANSNPLIYHSAIFTSYELA